MAQDVVRVGTRGSKLALVQTRAVIDALRAQARGIAFEERVIRTTGDRVTGVALSQIGARGLFTKEIENALLRGDVDVAVHSAKDVPTALPDGLCVQTVLGREDARDALVVRSALTAVRRGPSGDAGPLDALAEGAVVGTSSERRKAQLLHERPDLQVAPLRGNLDTRLQKLETERLDAIVVAAAGLARMGMGSSGLSRGSQVIPLPVDLCVPAAGQGALVVELRSDDERIRELVAPLRDEAAAASVTAERAALARLAGGCQVPVGLHAWIAGDRLRLRGVVAEPTGEHLVRAEGCGVPEEAERIGRSVAERLLDGGAGDIIDRARGGEHGGT